MLASQDHETLKSVLSHADVRAALALVQAELLQQLERRGLRCTAARSDVLASRLDVREVRRHAVRTEPGLSVEIRTLALGEGCLVVYLAAMGSAAGRRKKSELACAEVLRTPDVPNWRAAVDPVQRLVGVLSSDAFGTTLDWSAAAGPAVDRIEDALAR